jgi:tRNA A-37 threonylcarbamoyl transferase component Bud32
MTRIDRNTAAAEALPPPDLPPPAAERFAASLRNLDGRGRSAATQDQHPSRKIAGDGFPPPDILDRLAQAEPPRRIRELSPGLWDGRNGISPNPPKGPEPPSGGVPVPGPGSLSGGADPAQDLMSDNTGNLPSKYRHGGNARDGLFAMPDAEWARFKAEAARLRGETPALIKLVNRAEALVSEGKLLLLYSGFNETYRDPDANLVYRIGMLSEAEIRITVSAGKLGIGPSVDLAKSLYAPVVTNQPASNRSTLGIGVITMDYINGTKIDKFLRAATLSDQFLATEKIGIIIGKMHAFRLNHNDLNPSNIIVKNIIYNLIDPIIIDHDSSRIIKTDKNFLKDINNIVIYIQRALNCIDPIQKTKFVDEFEKGYRAGMEQAHLEGQRIDPTRLKYADEEFNELRSNPVFRI